MVSTTGPLQIERQPARKWRLILGALLLLIMAVNSARLLAPEGLPEALGRLTGLLILAVAAIWLIATGLPKSMGHPQIKAIRRRIWYKLAGIGLLVMAILAIMLALLSLSMVGVVITWLYWFGWTWIAWLIADKKAINKIQSKSESSPQQ